MRIVVRSQVELGRWSVGVVEVGRQGDEELAESRSTDICPSSVMSFLRGASHIQLWSTLCSFPELYLKPSCLRA